MLFMMLDGIEITYSRSVMLERIGSSKYSSTLFKSRSFLIGIVSIGCLVSVIGWEISSVGEEDWAAKFGS